MRVSPGLLEQVAASAAGISAVDGLDAHITAHRAGRQRTVLEYRFADGLQLVAKRYPQRKDALVSYDVLRAFEEQSFGEFVHRLRAHARRARLGDVGSDRATFTFLEEYAARAKGVTAGFAYYWSYSILATLLRALEAGRATSKKRLEFYRAEFDGVPRRVETLGQLAETKRAS